MARLRSIPTHTIKRMHFYCSGRTIMVEASEIGLKPGVEPMGRVYDDAIDEGCLIRNGDTGQEVLWIYVGNDATGDELQGWRFKPATEELNKNEKLCGWTLVIQND